MQTTDYRDLIPLVEARTTRQVRYGTPDRFVPVHDDPAATEAMRWYVYDAEKAESVAGPYRTQTQAVYVAAALTADPSCCPCASDDR